jgi:hypothetical protein
MVQRDLMAVKSLEEEEEGDEEESMGVMYTLFIYQQIMIII